MHPLPFLAPFLRLPALLAGACLLMAVWSCTGPRAEIPADIIREDSMVYILVDFHLAQARAHVSAPGSGSDASRSARYGEVMEKHAVTWPAFRRSMDYYARHPEVFTGIYDRVIEEISRKQAEAAAGSKSK